MGFQQVRGDIGGLLEGIGEDWTVTLETDPDIFHKMIVVGHPSLIDPRTFTAYGADITATLWVSEADDMDAADALYMLLSPGEGSVFNLLVNQTTVNARILNVTAANVGRRDEGPSGFLAADINIEVHFQ